MIDSSFSRLRSMCLQVEINKSFGIPLPTLSALIGPLLLLAGSILYLTGIPDTHLKHLAWERGWGDGHGVEWRWLSFRDFTSKGWLVQLECHPSEVFMEMAAELLLLFLVMSTFFIHFRPLQQSGQVICGYLWGQITKVVLGCTWNLAPETVPRELSCGSHVFGRECTPRASSNTLFSFSSMIQDLKISSKCFTSWRTSPWPVDVWWPLVLSYHRSASEALWNTAPGPDFVSTQWKKNITFSDQTHIESVFWASASAEDQWRAAKGICGFHRLGGDFLYRIWWMIHCQPCVWRVH